MPFVLPRALESPPFLHRRSSRSAPASSSSEFSSVGALVSSRSAHASSAPSARSLRSSPRASSSWVSWRRSVVGAVGEEVSATQRARSSSARTPWSWGSRSARSSSPRSVFVPQLATCIQVALCEGSESPVRVVVVVVAVFPQSPHSHIEKKVHVPVSPFCHHTLAVGNLVPNRDGQAELGPGVFPALPPPQVQFRMPTIRSISAQGSGRGTPRGASKAWTLACRHDPLRVLEK